MNRSIVSLLVLLAAGACTRGSGGSPTCGLALLAGPSLITSQLQNARMVLTDPPRGIPDSLPAHAIVLGRLGSDRTNGPGATKDNRAAARRFLRTGISTRHRKCRGGIAIGTLGNRRL